MNVDELVTALSRMPLDAEVEVEVSNDSTFTVKEVSDDQEGHVVIYLGNEVEFV